MSTQNPELRRMKHRRNLVRFRQILTDLTDILQKIESGELEDIWFIRRLMCSVLGVTKMTDDERHTRWIGWKKGTLIIGPIEPEYETTINGASERLRATRIAGVEAVKAPPDFPSRRMYDAAGKEKKRRDGVVLQ
jgi:hypothetical protein